MESRCIRCKGRGFCGGPCKILEQFKKNAPKVKLHFSGPSPPEIFVGRIGYPNINSGILAPVNYDTKHSELNSAEDWAKNNLSISNVLRLRGQLVYGKAVLNVKKRDKLRNVIDELALTHKSVSTEFFLKKEPLTGVFSSSSVFRPMTNPAPLKRVCLEENSKVLKRVDYLVNDNDIKAVDAINELSSVISVDHMQKLLSAGLLGKKLNQKMVPTRWSITAIDDVVSKNLLMKIRDYNEISDIQVLEGSYLANYIKILILPGKFSFEAIEVWESESDVGSSEYGTTFSQDYEGFFGRKTYAANITGGYYAMRIAVCEYLEKIKRQGIVFVLREITREYYAPLGVGIVREATRSAIRSMPVVFETKEDAFSYLRKNLKLKHDALEKSWTLKNYGKQKSLREWFLT